MPVETNKATVQNEGGQYELIPEGIYTVEVLDIELKEGIESKFGLKNKFYFKLGILEEELRGKIIMHFTTTAYTSGFKGGQSSKLYETACAIMGEKLDDKEALDVNTLIGGRFKAIVKHSQSGEKEYANITEVMKEDNASKKLPSLSDEEHFTEPKLDMEKLSKELPEMDLDS